MDLQDQTPHLLQKFIDGADVVVDQLKALHLGLTVAELASPPALSLLLMPFGAGSPILLSPRAAGCEEWGQLFQVYTFGSCSPKQHLFKFMSGGAGPAPTLMPSGQANPHLHHQGQLYCVAQEKCEVTLPSE